MGDRRVRIDSLTIRNYRGISECNLVFRRPVADGKPDVFVLGSRNGVGKTSILECAAFLLVAVGLKKRQFRMDILRRFEPEVDFPDLLIRAGGDKANVSGEISVGCETVHVALEFLRNGIVRVDGDFFDRALPVKTMTEDARSAEEFYRMIAGMASNPFLNNSFLFFHGYRKVQEGRTDLGVMLHGPDDGPRGFMRRTEGTVSAFKIAVLKNMMGEGRVLELDADDNPALVREKLDWIVRTYAGVAFAKLKLQKDSSLDFRVAHLNVPDEKNASFPFDSLSSGQKEIIATLFLIWKSTHDRPSVVFIDEPELHLNPEWHQGLVSTLFKLAPENQYIMATHSEDIMASVSSSSRILLDAETEVGA